MEPSCPPERLGCFTAHQGRLAPAHPRGHRALAFFKKRHQFGSQNGISLLFYYYHILIGYFSFFLGDQNVLCPFSFGLFITDLHGYP